MVLLSWQYCGGNSGLSSMVVRRSFPSLGAMNGSRLPAARSDDGDDERVLPLAVDA
jgi:hypothetical protein